MSNEREVALTEAFNKMDVLEEIWLSLGLDEDQQRQRAATAIRYVDELFNDMIKEEKAVKFRLVEAIQTHKTTLLQICEELGLPIFEPKNGLSILAQQKALREKVNELSAEKGERLQELARLRERDQHLCDVLQMTPYYIPSGTVPTREQLNLLEDHVAALGAEMEERTRHFKSTRARIVELMEELQRCPNTSLEKDVVCEEEESFLLSAEKMKDLDKLHKGLEAEQRDNKIIGEQLREDLNSLWERLQVDLAERDDFSEKYEDNKPSTLKAIREEITRCEELKLANMKQVTEGARIQLHEWWDKCFFTQEQRNIFTPLHSEDFTEELLEQHDNELNEVKTYYHQNAEMLEKVARWHVLWESFLEFERKASDPNRFFNRGCNLLKEEKARKKLLKELPKVEQDLAVEIEEWEKKNGRDFVIGGERFANYIKRQWETYNSQKENEKKQRLKARAKETESEMIYGSKPVTPAKRRFANTPGRTPSKVRKMNETPKTPGSVSRLANHTNYTSIFASPAHMTTRSATKKPRNLRNTPGKLGGKVLTDRNGTSNETIFSHTTLSSGTTASMTATNSSTISIASVGHYNEFATCLNQQTRNQCRSSVAPRPAFF